MEANYDLTVATRNEKTKNQSRKGMMSKHQVRRQAFKQMSKRERRAIEKERSIKRRKSHALESIESEDAEVADVEEPAQQRFDPYVNGDPMNWPSFMWEYHMNEMREWMGPWQEPIGDWEQSAEPTELFPEDMMTMSKENVLKQVINVIKSWSA